MNIFSKSIKTNLFLILSAFFFTSCTITGLTDGYSQLSPALKEKVGYSSKGDTVNKAILMVNGKELRERFDPNKTNVVFIYNPYCSAETCVHPSYVLRRLPKDAKLYVVPTILHPRAIKEAEEEYETYGMDKYYYDSKYVFKYVERFIEDLIGQKDEMDARSLYIFKGKKYLKKTDQSNPEF